jgi:PAS domain S-box-containing protein
MTIVMFGLFVVIVLLGLAHVAELRRRGRAELEAIESERRYRLLAESSFDMIVRFDPSDQRRTYISTACRRLYGYEPDEALSMSAAEIIHPDDLPKVQEALSQLEHADHDPITYRGRRKDGSYIWVEASLKRSRDPETGAAEVVSVVRDISERVRYEAALRQAKEQADAANRAKSEFLGTMSHELRTPLNAIIGFTDIMKEEVMGPIDNPHYRSYIADIHFSSTHLLTLINEILDATKAEAGKLELQEEVFDLREVIREVVRVSGPSIEKAGLTAGIELPSDLPLLRADEGKTRQVFFNLIGNSVKFTPAGGRIEIRGRFDSQTGVTISVADTGIGIAPEDLSRVLEPFVQVDSSLSRRHPGTGLGLPAVKRIMELHHGSFDPQSSVGSGTTATITFPAERAALMRPWRRRGRPPETAGVPVLLAVVLHDTPHASPVAGLHDVEVAPRVAPDPVAGAIGRPVAPARQALAVERQDADHAAVVLGDVDDVVIIDIEEGRADQLDRPDLEQFAVLVEHLHPVVFPVGDEHAAAPVDPDTMRQVELPRRGARLAPG